MESRIKNKVLRWLVQHAFPNELRIICLRHTGARIGEDVYIGQGFALACLLGNEKNLLIRDRVSIGPNVTIVLDSDPNNSRLRKHKNSYEFIEKRGRVVIENDAWLGAGVIVLPNVRIGEHSIAGAGSVVTKSIPSKTVVVGVPAKPIKRLEI